MNPADQKPADGREDGNGGPTDPPKARQAPPKWHATRAARFALAALFIGATIYVVAKSVDPAQFAEALKKMNPWWFLASFVAAMPAWLGAAIPIKVFSPPGSKVSLRDLTLVQVASSFVGVATPAGLGPLALSMSYLTKAGVSSARALAANILAQISQFLVSAVVVVFALVTTGMSPDVKIPWQTVEKVALVVLVVLALLALVTKWRNWVLNEARTFWDRTKPEIVFAASHPKQLLIALGGAVLQTTADVSSFLFAILAFGGHADWAKAAAVYLIFRTLGGLLPSPGGMGTVEASLTAGLRWIGFSTAQGVMIATGYRLATFYAPILLGWAALTYLRKKQLVQTIPVPITPGGPS